MAESGAIQVNPINPIANINALKGFGEANISRPGAAGQQFGYSSPQILSANDGPAGRFGDGQPLNIANPAATVGGGGDGGGIFDGVSLFGGTDAEGNETVSGLGAGLTAATSVFNIYSGLKGLEQQEEALEFQKDSFNRNFNASKAAFENKLRGQYGRKATLGGHKDQSEDEFVAERADF